MLSNFFHFLADSFHYIWVEQPMLHMQDQTDQIDRWVLDSHQQSEINLLDFSEPLDWGGSDFFNFLD